ncbi:MAG: RagB/SusD family nutrient uptake outer membrane protein [Mangrovibacterium sp.]
MRKIFYISFFIVLCLLFNSCEKDLDLFPKTTFSEATYFKTPEQFQLFANQFYLNLPLVGFSSDRDVYTDIIASRSTDAISNGSYSAAPTSPTWENSYKTIRNTTYLIQKGEEAGGDLKNQVAVYVAEAKFFRAFAYFDLFRDFGGVPIIDKVLDLNDTELLYGPRNSREEVYNYIIKDLDAAIPVLPLESAISANNKGRISKGAALGLKARIALFEGTWRKFRNMDGFNALLDQAIDASNQVITSGEYELFDRRDVLGDESYRYFFILDKVKSNISNLTKVDQKEYILANRYDFSIRRQPVTSSEFVGNPTKKFVDMMLCSDGLPIEKSPLYQGKQTVLSEYQNRDLRMKNIFYVPIPGKRDWQTQAPDWARNWSNPDAGGFIIRIVFGATTYTGYQYCKFNSQILTPSLDYPVIRYAEVLLINAEALYEKNGAIADAQLDATINLLRARAALPNLTNSFASVNGLDLRTEIRRERTVELFAEGKRFDDLRRWKTAETEMPGALKGVKWTGTQFATDPEWSSVVYPLDEEGYIIIEDASKRKFEQKHYLFPIPTRQILLNPQLEQNPGWE